MLDTPGAVAREEIGAWLAGVFCGVLVGSIMSVVVVEVKLK
jgi:hypothetical protein